MANTISPDRLSGIWSATPTPFTNNWDIDTVAVKRLIDHHLALGVKGLFLAGTCGEGPVMPERLKNRLVELAAAYSKGRLLLAVQVSDNSAARILDNVRAAKRSGADIGVIAPPYFISNNKPEVLRDLYLEAVRKSPLPIGIYDRGHHSPIYIPDSVLTAVYGEKNVIMIKDSSADLKRIKLAVNARKKRPNLRLLTGWEFQTVPYIKAGYDGCLLGGGIFNGYLARQIMEAGGAGDWDRAQKLQDRMNRMMWDVYGGKKITCWLSGLKKLLVEMGIFRTWKNYYNFPLKPYCVRAINRVLKRDADVLFPWKTR